MRKHNKEDEWFYKIAELLFGEEVADEHRRLGKDTKNNRVPDAFTLHECYTHN